MKQIRELFFNFADNAINTYKGSNSEGAEAQEESRVKSLKRWGDYGVIAYDEDALEYIESIPALMRSSADLQGLGLSLANALVTFSVISRLNSNKY